MSNGAKYTPLKRSEIIGKGIVKEETFIYIKYFLNGHLLVEISKDNPKPIVDRLVMLIEEEFEEVESNE